MQQVPKTLLQESMEKVFIDLQGQILTLPQGLAALQGVRVSPGEQRAGIRRMKPPTPAKH